MLITAFWCRLITAYSDPSGYFVYNKTINISQISNKRKLLSGSTKSRAEHFAKDYTFL